MILKNERRVSKKMWFLILLFGFMILIISLLLFLSKPKRRKEVGFKDKEEGEDIVYFDIYRGGK